MTSTTSSAVVRRVDHVPVLVSDPWPLYRSLVDVLGLPSVWRPFAGLGWSSGGVSFGNVVVEPLQVAPGRKVAIALDTGGLAIALEPTPEAGAELARRGIPHGLPFPYPGRAPEGSVTTDRSVVPPWTTTMFGGLLGNARLEQQLSRRFTRSPVARAINLAAARISRRPGPAAAIVAAATPAKPWAFLCEYHAYEITAMRAEVSGLLIDAGGGAIGLRGVREVVCEVPDPDEERGRWKRLLDPVTPTADGLWKMRDGPAIRIEAADGATRQHLVCEVASLDAALAALTARDIPAERKDSYVQIDPGPLAGLSLRMINA
jgi:hypothetical protein